MTTRRGTSWIDYVCFAEAFAALLFVRTVTTFAPFRTVAALASWPGSRLRRFDDELPHLKSVVLAIGRASKRLPIRNVCLHQGLAAQWMLRRRGVPAFLHYGVRKSEDQLTAHVWVTVRGKIIIGEAAASGHACVATFPRVDS